jgi:uncharacterized protein YciU (UPF0263 family)
VTSLGQIQVSLTARWRALAQEWQVTCEDWDDRVRYEFEREFWEEIHRAVSLALSQMEQLAQLFARARREVP